MMDRFKHADKTTFILFIFIVLISVMLIIAYKTKESIDYYTVQNNEITTLQLIDKELYDFTLTSNKFSNYDEVDGQEERFRNTLKTLYKD